MKKILLLIFTVIFLCGIAFNNYVLSQGYPAPYYAPNPSYTPTTDGTATPDETPATPDETPATPDETPATDVITVDGTATPDETPATPDETPATDVITVDGTAIPEETPNTGVIIFDTTSTINDLLTLTGSGIGCTENGCTLEGCTLCEQCEVAALTENIDLSLLTPEETIQYYIDQYEAQQDLILGLEDSLTFEEYSIEEPDRKSTRLNSSHGTLSRMPSSA